MKIRPASPHDMVAIAKLSRELAAHLKDPDPGPDASMLSDCASVLSGGSNVLLPKAQIVLLALRRFAEDSKRTHLRSGYG